MRVDAETVEAEVTLLHGFPGVTAVGRLNGSPTDDHYGGGGMSSGGAPLVREVDVPLSRREEHGTVVISVGGAISAELFSELDAEFRLVPVSLPVIINLNALTLGNANVLEQLVTFLRSLPGSRVCLVCGRLSARRVLRLVGAADIVPIFMTTADAMQVLILHEQGYGPGWSMTILTGPAATLAPPEGSESSSAFR
jgi:anti-anti-sigma regulatory factor